MKKNIKDTKKILTSSNKKYKKGFYVNFEPQNEPQN